jgi:hypothetical protein
MNDKTLHSTQRMASTTEIGCGLHNKNRKFTHRLYFWTSPLGASSVSSLRTCVPGAATAVKKAPLVSTLCRRRASLVDSPHAPSSCGRPRKTGRHRLGPRVSSILASRRLICRADPLGYSRCPLLILLLLATSYRLRWFVFPVNAAICNTPPQKSTLQL